jgi:nucleotide-binding universal stress UspA family protein
MFDNVLVGVDGRPGGRDAIALAKELAPDHATITLAHVYGGSTMGGRAAALAVPVELASSQQLLTRARAEAAVPVKAVAVYESSVGRGLHQAVEDRAADLLVVGSCHHGRAGQLFAGNDALTALRGAPCPVAIAPKGYADGPRPLAVLGVGSDDSPESDQALEAARAIATRKGSTIKAMSVIPLQSVPYGEHVHDNWPDIAKQLTGEELRRLRDLGDVEGEVTYGEPGEQLASFGEGVDLLVVGSRSVGPLVRWLNGSASDYLARRAQCPLLVLPRSAGGRDQPLAVEKEGEASVGAEA